MSHRLQVDTVARSYQLLAVPMLGATLAWKQRLEDAPAAAPLLSILDQCIERLLQHFSGALRDRLESIGR